MGPLTSANGSYVSVTVIALAAALALTAIIAVYTSWRWIHLGATTWRTQREIAVLRGAMESGPAGYIAWRGDGSEMVSPSLSDILSADVAGFAALKDLLAPDDGRLLDAHAQALKVESGCGAVVVGAAYLFPPLSSGGASIAEP